MMYIWQDYSADVRFVIEQDESAGTEAYRADTAEPSVMVNPWYRFSDVFQNAMHCPDDLQSILLHFLAQLDFYAGTDNISLLRELLSNELRSGSFGKQAADCFETLDAEDQRLFLAYLALYIESGERQDLFDRFFFAIFGRVQNLRNPRKRWDGTYSPCSAQVYYRKSEDCLYYYCAAEENTYNVNCFKLARLLFADAKRKIRPVWGRRCFGVIGENGNCAAAPRVGMTQIVRGG